MMEWIEQFKKEFPELTKYIIRGDLNGMCSEVPKLKRLLKKK